MRSYILTQFSGLIVLSSLSGDYNPLHIDPEFAKYDIASCRLTPLMFVTGLAASSNPSCTACASLALLAKLCTKNTAPSRISKFDSLARCILARRSSPRCGRKVARSSLVRQVNFGCRLRRADLVFQLLNARSAIPSFSPALR